MTFSKQEQNINKLIISISVQWYYATTVLPEKIINKNLITHHKLTIHKLFDFIFYILLYIYVNLNNENLKTSDTKRLIFFFH